MGFVLLDASLRLLYANSDAVRIFAYPVAPAAQGAVDTYVARKTQRLLEPCCRSQTWPAVIDLQSGRRRYICHAFALGAESYGAFAPSFEPHIAAVIERPSRVSGLQHVGDHFGLTRREREAMALLLHGLTSKEIAARMNVSPNTVKAFLRFIMLKMGVSTRSAIVGRVLASSF